MCGIAGAIVLKNKPLSEKQKSFVEKMLISMKHRGPDETGIVVEENYALGSVRLTIVDSELGQQPLKNESACLVFNGEIYNYKDLTKEYLSCNNASSDSHTLFALLNEYQMDKLNVLNGMFSFCYVNGSDIYLVRDRFGKKPLYYTTQEDCLLFASELKAFREIVDFELALPSMYRYLETPLDGETVFKNIFEVNAGSFIKIDQKDKRLSKHRYYSLLNIKEEQGDEKYLTEKLRWLVEDAIKIRTDTYLNYGVYISGGLDSSIIALLTKPQYLFTYLPQSDYIGDEERYADIIASHLPESSYEKIRPTNRDILKNLINTVYFNDGPTTTLAALSQYELSQAFSSRGLRLSLSGLGADEIFNGYIRHAVALVPHRYFTNAIFKQYTSLIDKTSSSGHESVAAKYANLLLRSTKTSNEFENLVGKIFAKSSSSSSAISICDFLFTLPPLLHTDDHLNMAFGIESRSPFLDYRLVNFALGLPDDMKININQKRNISLKYLLKEAFRDILPKEIYLRKDKIGFSSNVNDVLRGELRHLVNNAKALLRKHFQQIKFFEEATKPSHPYARGEYQLVQLAITYLIYCRKYTPEEVELVISKGVLL